MRITSVIIFTDKIGLIAELDTTIRTLAIPIIITSVIHRLFNKTTVIYKTLLLINIIYAISTGINIILGNTSVSNVIEHFYNLLFYSMFIYPVFMHDNKQTKILYKILYIFVYILSMYFVLVLLQLFTRIRIKSMDIVMFNDYIFINNYYPAYTGFVLSSLIFTLLLLIIKENRSTLLSDSIFILTNLALLMLVGSRSAYYSLLLSLVTVIFFINRKKVSILKNICICFAMIAIAICFNKVLIVLLNNSKSIIVKQYLDDNYYFVERITENNSSITIRIDIWKSFIESLFNNIRVVLYGVTETKSIEYLKALNLEAVHTHNEFFELLLTHGIFFSLSLAFAFFYSLYKFIFIDINKTTLSCICFGILLSVIMTYFFEATYFIRLFPQTLCLFIAFGNIDRN